MDAAILLMCIKDLTCVTFSCICEEKNQNLVYVFLQVFLVKTISIFYRV